MSTYHVCAKQAAAMTEFNDGRMLAKIEREHDVFEAATKLAESEVTFNEVLKRMRSASVGRKVTLMSCMDNDKAHFAWLLETMFRDAFSDQCIRRARRELSKPRHVDLQDEA